ncbi:S-layer homology domain-containing protein [Cohnella lupini]|uniref:Cohesin domain-containing protein n=1 Tax=Cohnella lupini TaxID=1294267 RepID=A0A3D9IBW2_9BACL|nr:S-layer homology domain-containing protein [Cohnella lupini]RED59177.1 cohesin domain-containing protein [Cohnella lupini]
MNLRWINFSLIVLLGLSLFPITALGASTPSFTIVVNKSTAGVGEEVSVTVRGDQIQDLYGYEIHLTYDPKHVRFKSASALWPGFSVPDSDDDGEVVFAHTKLGQTKGENGSLDIAKFSFIAKDSGDAAITLTRVKLVDSKIQSVVETSPSKAALQITPALPPTFTDINGHWARLAIEEATRIGFVSGYPDRTFRPNAKINRAEFAAMLARGVKLTAAGESRLDYADSDQIPKWAAPYVANATAAGAIVGYSDRTFRWSNNITRAEMTVMIIRASSLELSQGTPSGFADDGKIPVWAYDEVSTAKATGLIQGKSNNLFDSFGTASRAEAVTMILNLLHQSEK